MPVQARGSFSSSVLTGFLLIVVVLQMVCLLWVSGTLSRLPLQQQRGNANVAPLAQPLQAAKGSDDNGARALAALRLQMETPGPLTGLLVLANVTSEEKMKVTQKPQTGDQQTQRMQQSEGDDGHPIKSILAKQTDVRPDTRPPPPPPSSSSSPLPCRFQIEYDARQRGADLSHKPTHDLMACGQWCLENPRCVGATFQRSFRMCWAHHASLGTFRDPEFDFVRRVCEPSTAGANATNAPSDADQRANPKKIFTDLSMRNEANVLAPIQPQEASAAAAVAAGGGAFNATTETSKQNEASSHTEVNSFAHLSNAALAVLCHNRAQYLRETLEHLVRARLSDQFPHKYISQDGHDVGVAQLSQQFVRDHPHSWRHLQKPDDITAAFTAGAGPFPFGGASTTVRVAAHYRWLLDQLFVVKNHSHAILVEDDLVVSPDFFTFFEQTAVLLDIDPTIWCISSWNDNGFAHFHLPPDRLFRNSYFPGLGWMLKRTLWVEELRAKFPNDHWDHWMRASAQHRGRDCICPFLSRNHNIGKVGTNVRGSARISSLVDSVVHNTDADVSLGNLTHLTSPHYQTEILARKLQSKAATIISSPTLSSLASGSIGINWPVFTCTQNATCESSLRRLQGSPANMCVAVTIVMVVALVRKPLGFGQP